MLTIIPEYKCWIYKYICHISLLLSVRIGHPCACAAAAAAGWARSPRTGGAADGLNKTKKPRVFSQHTTTNQNTGMKGKLKNAKQTSCIPYFEILGKNYYLCTTHKTLLNMESRHQILLDSVFRMSLAWIGFSQIWHFVTAWT